MYVTIFIVSLIVVIMIHEFGHFVTAKAFGMKAEKFFLGFGPTLWSVQKGETEYGVKLIPAGGFVKITGMSSYEDTDPADAGRRFFEKPAWQRLVVLVAGSVTHFIIAAVLLFAALAFIGLPVASNEVAEVSDDSPAADAGLAQGDVIVAVDGVPTGDFEEVRDAVVTRGGQTVTLAVERDGVTREIETTIAERTVDGREQGFLGVGPAAVERPLPVGEAAAATVVGEWSVWRWTSMTVQGLGQAFSPQGISRWLGALDADQPRSPEGPMSVVGVGQAVSAFGQAGDLFAIIFMLVQLNIVLGLLNMLPLPPLDGGHVATLAVEQGVNGVRRLRGKAPSWRLDPAVITPIALAVILFFTVLTVTVVYIDIVNPATELLQ
ncbi:MAG TPA: site-2 protease family protein [Egibacteraceae bacterium]|nr:site-2 protease family protein [Egibacteraceae bacterium]